MITLLLILHGLTAVALLGAVSHQAASLFFRQTTPGGAFVSRYARVDAGRFTVPVIWLYLVVFVLGSVIYPAYRVDVRIPFEELGLLGRSFRNQRTCRRHRGFRSATLCSRVAFRRRSVDIDGSAHDYRFYCRGGLVRFHCGPPAQQY